MIHHIKSILILFVALAGISSVAEAQKKTVSNLNIDSLPLSEINIPIDINLRDVYTLAENSVDTVFTSPGYPGGWVQADCATRYQYHFRRSPLKMSMQGTSMKLGFMGYYQIIGSTRACVGSTVLSPWTPSCRCGFDEAERRVNIAFNAGFRLQDDYLLRTTIIREEPQPLDKCSVCFWGQDITTEVMKGLKSELDASKKAMTDSFGVMKLRPYMQQAWNMLNQVYAIPNVGYFSLHPKRLRMENLNAKNDLLHIDLGISASPVVSFVRGEQTTTVVPDLSHANNPGGFNIYLEAALQYDSLSKVMNGFLAEKRFDINEGMFKKHIIIKEAAVTGSEDGNMVIRLDFDGSFEGTAYFKGQPYYNSETRTVEMRELDYNLKTNNVLLKTAGWLFNGKIISTLKKYSSIELGAYYDLAGKTLNEWLNREWTKGVTGKGKVKELKLVSVNALPAHLLIRSNCTGDLSVNVSQLNLKF